MQAMQHAGRHRTAPVHQPLRRKNQRNGGRQRKAHPGRQRTAIAGTHHPDAHTHLAAGRPWQKLAERYQIRIRLFAQPAPLRHQGLTEIAQMGCRTTKTGQAQLQENQQYLHGRRRL